MQKINQDRIKSQEFQNEDKSTRESGLKEFNGYRNHSAFRGKFKASLNLKFVHSAGGGLAGSTNSSKSIPSVIRVAAAMKVSMKD